MEYIGNIPDLWTMSGAEEQSDFLKSLHFVEDDQELNN